MTTKNDNTVIENDRETLKRIVLKFWLSRTKAELGHKRMAGFESNILASSSKQFKQIQL